MAFLKRKSTTNGHSRSGSASSALNKHVDPANISEFYPSCAEYKANMAGVKTEHSHDSSNKSSRKSSGGSTNSLTSEKLLFNWDVTDPSQWTMSRIVQWFRSNDFSEQWIAFFKRNGISGNKFLKLLAHDNFAAYEKMLPYSKTSCYERFQYLLKKTLEENVVKGNNRSGSRASNNSRSSSESAKTNQRLSSTYGTHIRSTSESALLNSSKCVGDGITLENGSSKKQQINDIDLPLRHSKTNSASALYRRSLISLRNVSLSKDTSTKNDIKITIPPRPFSTIDDSDKTPTTPSTISPSHTGYSNMFRRQHKTNNSEASTFTTPFSNGLQGQSEKEKSNDQLNEKKSLTMHTDQSSFKQSPHPVDEKARIWDKIKRKGPPAIENETQSKSQQLPSVLNVSSMDEDIEQRNESVLDIPADVLPRRREKSESVFIMLTGDNTVFSPFNVQPFLHKSISELKESMAAAIGIAHTNFSLHFTDFDADFGCELSDALLESLQQIAFKNVPHKLYIKDLRKKSTSRTRAGTLASQASATYSARSKSSVKSNATSNGDTSSSDLVSVEDLTSSNHRIYPQTPSHYYDTPEATEADYWSFKEPSIVPEAASDTAPMVLPKSRPSLKLNSSALSSHATENTTFRIIRKSSDTDIDFNKRRESPYVRVSELAPKRKAPKPPTLNGQSSSSSIPTVVIGEDSKAAPPLPKQDLTDKTNNFKSKPRPPPPLLAPIDTTQSQFLTPEKSRSVRRLSPVQSFTPASTHVIVPQPYKGATDSVSTRKSNADLTLRPRMSLKQFSRSNSSVNKHVLATSIYPIKRTTSKGLVSSTTAADVFDENEISFADAPDLSDSDGYSSGSDEIIWSRKNKSKADETAEFSFNTEDSMNVIGTELTEVSIINAEDSQITRKMTLRPSPDVVYQNLEMFFPDADLDNPILEGLTPPPSPNADSTPVSPKEFEKSMKSKQGSNRPLLGNRGESAQFLTPVSTLKPPRRAKTIRIIAQEASEARKNMSSKKLQRRNTKMWGTKVVEITDKSKVSINKARNSRGEYKEFAWIKGEIIGKGSFGTVYLALNVTTGEMMAVKQVTVPEFSSQDESVLNMVEALQSEVSTLKDLNHLNIVQYLGFEEKSGIYSLFLEYVAGGSVGSLIRMYGRFDDQLIRHLTVQVLEGLSYLHSKGILHRDMKADNLLLDTDGICKISDFGISKRSNNIYTNSDMTMRGTVFWMAPEMVDTAHGYSAKVDIWSLGCVVLEMFAGKRPWSNFEVVAAMFQIGKTKTAPPIPDDTKHLISLEGLDFLDKCFEINPESRPTADTLLTHSFCKTNLGFEFPKTKIADFIKSNDKLNNSRLRLNSDEL